MTATEGGSGTSSPGPTPGPPTAAPSGRDEPGAQSSSAEGASAGAATHDASGSGQTPQFRYVEEMVRHQLSESFGGVRGMLEGALPFIAFTVTWVLTRQLYPSLGAAVGVAVVLGIARLVQRQSLKFVAQAVLPIALAALIASRTGRAEDVFLPGILYNGALAVVSVLTIVFRVPLVGFVLGAALGDPVGWRADRGLVRMTSKLTAVLAVPYLLRFVIQLPLFLTQQVVWLGVAKVVLGWPLLLAALAVIGLMLSKGRTPIEGSALTGDARAGAARP